MSICIISCVFPPEPVVSSEISYSLTEVISKKNNVIVVCPPASRPLGFKFPNPNNIIFSNPGNVNFNRLNSFTYSKSNPVGRLLEGISFGLQCYLFICKHKKNIDKVYMNTWPLFGQLGVALACKKFKIQYIVHIQDIYPESLVNKLPKYLSFLILFLLLPIEKYVLRNANKIIVISQYMELKIFSRGKIGKDKIFIVNNWQDDKIFDISQNRFENKKLTFMYLGNIGPVANIPHLIQTFFESKIDARLIIAGSGSKKSECQNLVKHLGVSNVDFLDVPAGEVAETQAMADILILPTIKNGAKSSIPSKLPAYMFSKKPIFALVDINTDTSKAILESNSGWVVRPESKEEIIQHFKMISQIHKSEFLKMGVNAYNYAKENFLKEKNLSKLVSLIFDK